ncbi:hypothetical protein D3C80_1234210 [compost metagenome]
MGDQAMLAAAQFQADFWQLGGFTRAGLAGNDQHLMFGQDLLDLIALGCDGQAVIVANARHTVAPCSDLGEGRLDLLDPLRQLGFVRLLAQLVQLATQAMAVGDHGLIEVFQQLVDSGRLVGHRVRSILFEWRRWAC